MADPAELTDQHRAYVADRRPQDGDDLPAGSTPSVKFVHDPNLWFTPVTPEPIEVEARRLVEQGRNEQYGEPEDNFARIGHAWTAILDTEVSAKQVALCMAALKIVREAHLPKRDSRVDAVGYLIAADKVEEKWTS